MTQAHYIKEWRKFRGLTQTEMAAKIKMGRSYLSMIETGERRYDQNFLEAAAPVLECTTGDLISNPPGQKESIGHLINRLEDNERQRVEAAVRAMLAQPGPEGHK